MKIEQFEQSFKSGKKMFAEIYFRKAPFSNDYIVKIGTPYLNEKTPLKNISYKEIMPGYDYEGEKICNLDLLTMTFENVSAWELADFFASLAAAARSLTNPFSEALEQEAQK